MMSRFLIESKHTKEECLKALDELSAKGPDILGKYDFACGAGEHTGWATVDAPSEKEARGLVPEFLQGKTKVVEVSKFTPEQIRQYHRR
jgi:hypothetical protein